MSAAGHPLDLLFGARSVAIIGASDDPTRIGGRPIAYFRAASFPGRLYPINPKRERVQGLRAYPSLAAVGEPIDFAIVALPAALCLAAVKDCVAAGLKACVIFSSGFAETGPEGASLQAEIAAVAKAGGLRVVGPNSLGLFAPERAFYAAFTTTLDRGLPQPGRLSIVSQSGAFGSHLYFLARERGLGLRCMISTGNECDLEVGECIGWLAEDPGTDVILAYAEGVKSGATFRAGLGRAQAAGKPVVFMKVGRSPAGAAAAQSHTAALSGSDAVFDAVFRETSAHRARTTEELIDVARAALARPLPRGPRLGLVTISGGVGVLMADAASDHGLSVPPLPEPAQRELKALIPFAAVRNPVDITAQAFNDMSLVAKNFRVLMEQGGYDAILCFFSSVAGSAAISPGLMEAVAEIRRAYPQRPFYLSALLPPEQAARYEAMGVPVYEDPSRAVAAIAALVRMSESFEGARRRRRSAEGEAAPRRAAQLPAGALDEGGALELLAAAGVPTVPFVRAQSVEEAVAAFRSFGRPVALKIASPDIPHKTEVGGVLLGVTEESQVRAGYDGLLARAARARPDARLSGVLVMPMVAGGLELILGARRDPLFGPLVLCGLGGVHAETLGDVALRLAPIGEEEALEMLGELKGHALLRGARGRSAADLRAVARALAALSCFAAAAGERLESLDLNPFLVLPEGQGALALDALIVTREG